MTASNILDFNAEAWFYFTIFVIKNMIKNFTYWESLQTEEMSGDFTKRVSFWHKNTLDGMMKYITENHTPPTFLSLNGIQAQSSFDLHTILLNQASSHLIEEYSDGVGNKTRQSIVEWFLLLQRTQPYNLLTKSSDAARFRFNSLYYEFTNTTPQHSADKEFLFFCPEILFIYITHLVSFYTHSPLAPTLQNPCYDEWEEISGDIVQNVLHLTTGGLTMLCPEELSKQAPSFGPITLPYQEWYRKTSLTKGGHLPQLDHLQEAVLNTVGLFIFETLHTTHQKGLSLPHKAELDKLTLLSTMMHRFTKDSTPKLKNAENQRRHYRLTEAIKKTAYKYKSRPPQYFQRDIFTMGNQSYYYQFCTSQGQQQRAFLLSVLASRRENHDEGAADNELLTAITQCVVS